MSRGIYPNRLSSLGTGLDNILPQLMQARFIGPMSIATIAVNEVFALVEIPLLNL